MGFITESNIRFYTWGAGSWYSEFYREPMQRSFNVYYVNKHTSFLMILLLFIFNYSFLLVLVIYWLLSFTNCLLCMCVCMCVFLHVFVCARVQMQRSPCSCCWPVSTRAQTRGSTQRSPAACLRRSGSCCSVRLSVEALYPMTPPLHTPPTTESHTATILS